VNAVSPRGSAQPIPVSGWGGPVAPTVLVVAVLAAVLATYWPALSAGALYMDDKFYLGPITQHPSWASVKTIFGEVFSPSMVNGYYQPLSLLSIMLDFLDPAAANSLLPFHRTTLLLHVLNVGLVVALLYVLFGKWLTACLVGLLYGLHPLNADAVLWIAERKTVLSTAFALSSLLLYVSYARKASREGRGDWKRYGGALFMYLCAVLAKPTALPVAALLPVLDYWPLGYRGRKALLDKVPFVAVGVLCAVVTVVSQAHSGDSGQTHFMKPHYLPLVMGYSVGFYLLKLVYPAGLVSDYSAPQAFGLTNVEVLGYTIVALGLVAAIALSVQRTRAWLAGGLFFGIAILPTLGIVRFTSSMTSNRSMYLPLVGLLLPLTWQLNRWWDSGAFALKATGARAIVVGLGVGIYVGLAIGCALATRGYQAHWRDSVGLLQHYISQRPGEWKFHTRLGNEWIQRRLFPLAIVEFKEAARLNPAWPENHLNLGRASFTVGDLATAKQSFATALQQTPNDWRAHMLMGTTLVRQQDHDGALREFHAAAGLAPRAAQPHFNLAEVLAAQGRAAEAAEEYRQTLRLEPRFAEAQTALDRILAESQGDLPQAKQPKQPN
jgi:Flp pilus assembly protein TadD